jgi:hypothetical protein
MCLVPVRIFVRHCQHFGKCAAAGTFGRHICQAKMADSRPDRRVGGSVVLGVEPGKLPDGDALACAGG